nr:hypothetical protein [Mycobacterium sp. E3339]
MFSVSRCTSTSTVMPADDRKSTSVRSMTSTAGVPASATSLRVAADGSATSRPLRIVGLDEFIDLYPTVDEALAGAPPGPTLT